jgi:hypothetical protein
MKTGIHQEQARRYFKMNTTKMEKYFLRPTKHRFLLIRIRPSAHPQKQHHPAHHFKSETSGKEDSPRADKKTS